MNQYPEIAISGSQVQTQISAYPDTRSIVIYNESPYFLRVSLTGSGTYGLAAYTADCFQVFSGFTGGIVFYPTQYIAINSGTTVPASVIFIQAYGQNEPLTKLIQANNATGYPMNLSRLQNIGNGAQVSGQASSIVNDKNAANTSIIEATPVDATASTWQADNEGNLTIHGNNAGVLVPLLKLIAGASPSVQVATNGVTTFLFGPANISQTLSVQGSSSLDNGAITSDGIGNVVATSLKCGSPKITTTGYTGITGDQLARLGSSAGTGTGTFNHNLGAIPDFVAITTHAVNGSQTVGYDSETSTQIHVTTGAGLAWFALLTKRS